MNRHTPFAMLMMLAAGSGTAAQTLYKSTMPDGKVVYSEQPVAGAKRVDTVEPPPSQTGVTVVSPGEKARLEQQQRQRAAAPSSSALDTARKQLQQAQAAREAGKEPLPGERLGTAGGASRLTDAYFERQKGLEAAVDAARKRMDQAQASR